MSERSQRTTDTAEPLPRSGPMDAATEAFLAHRNLATRIARGAVVPAGRAARQSRVNVRHPAASATVSGRGGDAPSARAASLASSAALPVPRSGAAVAEALTLR
jgi:hypothetical protein